MKHAVIPGIDKPVSRLVQGCMMLREDDLETSFRILDDAHAVGINAFDNSVVYGGGQCDRVFGSWLRQRDLVDQTVIIAKGCHHNRDRKRVTPYDLHTDVSDTLARMAVPRLDLWCFHRDDPSQPVGPLVEAANREIDQGRIGAWGASNWSVARLQSACAHAADHGLRPPVASSPNFSLARQIDSPWGSDCITISGPEHENDRAWYLDHGLAVLTWSSLARGFLTGRLTRDNLEATRDQWEEHVLRCYVCEDNWQRLDRLRAMAVDKGVSMAQLALAWVLSADFAPCALVASCQRCEAEENAAAVDLRLNDNEVAFLDLRQPFLAG